MEEVKQENKDDNSENKISIEHQETEVKPEVKSEKAEVAKPVTKEREKSVKSEPIKTTEKEEDTGVKVQKEKEAKPETKGKMR